METSNAQAALPPPRLYRRSGTPGFAVKTLLVAYVAGGAFAWHILPAGSEVSSGVTPGALRASNRGLQEEQSDWIEVDAGGDNPPAWLADPYTLEWPNTIAVCAMMKEEHAKDIQEFLEYHRWVGVDTFYLREHANETARDTLAVLEPYERAGVLDFDVLYSETPGLQTRWYNRCSKLAARKHAWVAFIDVDEFIVVLDKGRAVAEQGALKDVMRRHFRYTAAVSLQWVLFGTSGRRDRPPGGQLRGFQKCAASLSKQMKCLGNAYWLHKAGTFRPKRTQQCTMRIGGVAVLGNGEPLPMWEVAMDRSTGFSSRRGGAKRPLHGDSDSEHSPLSKQVDATGASYMSHLSAEEHEDAQDVTLRYQLALFHYITGSENAFLTRKHAIAGAFSAQFDEMVAANPGAERRDVLGRFEVELGLNGDHGVCREGAVLADAMDAAKASGLWSPFPEHEGLLFE
eukprot:jgi/Ulvmu1/11817/UM080_0028.1